VEKKFFFSFYYVIQKFSIRVNFIHYFDKNDLKIGDTKNFTGTCSNKDYIYIILFIHANLDFMSTVNQGGMP